MDLSKHINLERVKEITFEQFKKECGFVLSKYSLDAVSTYKTLNGGATITKIQSSESGAVDKKDTDKGKRKNKKPIDKSNI